jgi:hypothetical protein
MTEKLSNTAVTAAESIMPYEHGASSVTPDTLGGFRAVEAAEDTHGLDMVVHALGEIAQSAHEHHAHTTDSIEAVPSNPFTEFIEQHHLSVAPDAGMEIIERTAEKLDDVEVRRQHDVIDTLLTADDKGGLLEFLNREKVIDADALKKVITSVGNAVFDSFWADEDPDARILYGISTAIASKLKNLSAESFPSVADSMVANGGAYKLVGAVIGGDAPTEPVAEVLMRHSRFDIIAEAIEDFPSVDKDQLIDELYARGEAGVLLNCLRSFPDLNKAELAEQLLALDDCSALVYHMSALPDLDTAKLLHKLYEQDKAWLVMSHLEDFSQIDKTELIMKCIEQHSIYCIADSAEVFVGADIAAVKQKLLEMNDYEVFLQRRDVFPEIPMEEITNGLIADERGYALVNAIGTTPELTAESVYRLLIDTDQVHAIVAALDKFPGVDAHALMKKAVDEGAVWTVMSAIDSVPGIDKRLIVEYAIGAGHGYVLKDDDYQKRLADIPQNELIGMFLKHRQYADLLNIIGTFKEGDPTILENHFTTVLSSDALLTERDFNAVNEYMIENIPSSRQPLELRLANRYMSFSGATAVGYNIVRALHNEQEIPLEAERVGVTKTGIKGLEQFGVSCGNISRNLMDVTMTDTVLAEIQQSELYQGILQKMYRVDAAEFGDNSNAGVKKLLDYYLQAQQDGRITPLDAQYTPASVEVFTLKSDKEKVELTEDARNRYGILRDDTMKAIAALETKRAFSQLTRNLGDGIIDEIAATQQQIDLLAREGIHDTAGEYKSKNLQIKEQSLSTLITLANEGKYMGRNFALQSPASMSAVLTQLEPFDRLHADMRQIIFAWALRKNPQMVERMKNLSEEPSVEDIAEMRTFVDQIVNNETFGNYFSDKKAAMKFKKLTSVRALDEALVRHQSQAEVESQQLLQIMPTRSFPMELSGHVADACWASKYDSMAEQFPNMTSLLLKRGEDGSIHERLVGSAMLIETTDEKGMPVLLLRGVNPIENYINKVQVSDFYNAITGYCKTIAERKGMQPAIVIDDMSGASGTNRPALHDYMEKMKAHMRNIAVDETTTTFNGYDVTQKSYALQ